jgi:hypothetical protein
MATYYFNGAAILAPFTIVSNEPAFNMTTVSLKTQRASQGHQRWELTFSVQPTSELIIDSLIGQLGALDTSSTMIMPQLATGNTVDNNVTAHSSASAGATSVQLEGTGVTGLLPKGSFVKFQGQDKVYITTADVTFDNVVDPYVSIYPPLRSAVASSTNFHFRDSCQITYFQSIDNATGITFTDGVLANPGTITLIEAL